MAIVVEKYKKDKQLSPHFALSEFRCKSGSKNVKYSEETVTLLEKIFDACSNVGKAIITSGYRTPEYSVKVGGSKDDGHTVGIAVDVKWYDKTNKLIEPKYVACVAQDIGFTGIGIMKNSIHLDTRTTKNYKNGKWWGDETNGKSGIKDFYTYFNLTRTEVDKVLGREEKTSPVPDRTNELEAEIKKLKTEIEVLTKTNETLEAEIKRLKVEFEAKIEELKEENETLTKTNETLEAEISKYKAVIENVKKLLR